MSVAGPPKLLAVSDLHVGYPENRKIVQELRPASSADWLLVAGDVGDLVSDIEWALRALSERFATVVWTPGNHELWTRPQDQLQLRGEERYRYLVRLCRSMGIVTPEDPYPTWEDADGAVTVAPLFVLYDYTFRPAGAMTKEAGLQLARQAGVMCADEVFLHPDPYPSREAWCQARLAVTEQRLAECDQDHPTVLVSHFPLRREPTRVLHYPEFAQWCGTEGTADWHLKFRATTAVYGHLHIPRITWYDGVRFEEVSLGYPREWQRRAGAPSLPRQILPASGQAR